MACRRIAKWHRGICIHNAIPRITNTMQDPHWMYGSNKWVQNQTLPTERDHSGYGISRWEEALRCNASFHWLSPYPKWSLNRLMQYHCISIVNPCPVVHRMGQHYFCRCPGSSCYQVISSRKMEYVVLTCFLPCRCIWWVISIGNIGLSIGDTRSASNLGLRSRWHWTMLYNLRGRFKNTSS